MSGFLDRAREAAQRGLDAGMEKVEEVQALRAGQDLMRRLGAAYYAEQRGSGAHESVNAALEALDRHIKEHGDACLRGTAPGGGATS